MARSWHVGWTVVCACVVAGCSSGSPSGPAPQATGPSDPAARSAYEFFDAVLKGDTQRASSQLTPLAMQRIIERGEQFSPPGDDGNVSFRVGEVVHPNDTEALVQCVLTEATTDAGQGPQDTEVYCLLRLVEGQWRVSGIAHTTGPQQTPMILDFETGSHTPVPQGTPSQTAPHMATRPGPETGVGASPTTR